MSWVNKECNEAENWYKICLIINEQNKLSSYKGTQSYWNHSDCNPSVEHQWAAASTGWIISHF